MDVGSLAPDPSIPASNIRLGEIHKNAVLRVTPKVGLSLLGVQLLLLPLMLSICIYKAPTRCSIPG